MPFQQICQVGTMLSVGVGIVRSHRKFGPIALTSQLLVVVHHRRQHQRRQHQHPRQRHQHQHPALQAHHLHSVLRTHSVPIWRAIVVLLALESCLRAAARRPPLRHRPLLRIVVMCPNPAKLIVVTVTQSNQIVRPLVAAGSQLESGARLLGATIHHKLSSDAQTTSLCDCPRLQALFAGLPDPRRMFLM